MTSDVLEKLRTKLVEDSVDGLLISKPENWRYVSGFTGDSGVLLITAEHSFLFTDSRYTEQARSEAPDFTVVKTVIEEDVVKNTVNELGLKRIGFEKDYVTYAMWERLRDRFEKQELVGISGWVEELRMIKTSEEVEYISRAQKIAENAFERLLPLIKVGTSEIDLALELEFTMRKMGSEGVAFPFIVVSGPRSSLPHGQPSTRKLEPGDFVTFDFGARFQGYCSDMTRTIVIGPLDEKHKEIYEVVLAAQLTALDVIGPGVIGKEVDLAGRKVIEEAGYGEYFGHGIGHGVGLNVHERPSVGRTSEDILEPGMVITVEPGIYIEGFGGVRIEDMVVVTEEGMRNLTASRKELIVV
ncbi:MAG TPA: Xaa-Pro peptidase family protein [Bacillota bacterium]|nr:Xaa-Pro peptidase family protein [Bacillota bacterium]HOL11769.1 Xaa-Pro peptidase family protein [Bacillota bacterium]HPP60818.1 Xaa-Pro peptidase family protein [Bacillota bacterium]HPV12755.1 Xaa-Pro peptidase family protein [Bacillota bacterium]